jgi:hypothetical protein
MKAVIQPDHIPLNKFELIVLGLPPFTFTALSGLEEELDVVDLPDRTVASGGRTGPVEIEVMLPAHHIAEQAAMELWFQESQDPVLPTYKKPGTLLITSISGGTVRSFSMPDLFPSKRTIPDFEFDNDGELAEIGWTLRASDVLPI